MTEAPTAATIHAQAATQKGVIDEIVKRIQLKKWVIENVVEMVKDCGTDANFIKEVTQFFYSFVTGEDNEQPKG